MTQVLFLFPPKFYKFLSQATEVLSTHTLCVQKCTKSVHKVIGSENSTKYLKCTKYGVKMVWTLKVMVKRLVKIQEENTENPSEIWHISKHFFFKPGTSIWISSIDVSQHNVFLKVVWLVQLFTYGSLNQS